jgi:hypothetical protein
LHRLTNLLVIVTMVSTEPMDYEDIKINM